jgi:hypothetical protein
MKWIRTFDDRDIIESYNFNDISLYISQEISLGGVKSYDIDHSLYKSGDYICSSFTIQNTERIVIVSSIIINDSDTICINGGRHYNTLGDYVLQYGIKTDKYLYVGFGEYVDGKYNYDENVNDNSTLFRKMATIIDIIGSMISHYDVNYIILNSVDNDLSSGLKKDYKKRDKFYELFLAYHNIKYWKIKESIEINGEIVRDFLLLDLL